ncbi:MAG TPA: hypothetical protein VHW44_06005 [Pseudonocardiaceae bacterium]|nr:hypothetical protein [Pseudonocardiaceae bacterium]
MTEIRTAQAPSVHRLPAAVAPILAVEAVSLGVMSFLHLTGTLAGSGSARPAPAGMAEALIGVVLVVAAAISWRVPDRAWPFALGAIVFALIGFAVGISITIRGGAAVDIAYHATMLPILVATLVLILRGSGRRATLVS